MSTFLSRPVFDFDVNWSNVPVKQYSANLGERQLAYALRSYELFQAATVQSFQFEMILPDEAAIAAWDVFTATLQGRLGGFWFPSPFEALVIEPDVSSNVTVLIKDQNLRAYLADHPSVYYVFEKEGETTLYGKVSACVGMPDGREQITFNPALDAAVDNTWYVRKLLYMRLSDDQEDAQFLAEGAQARQVKVTELPMEYASFEVGSAPVYLYEFFTITDSYVTTYRLTGLNQDIVSQSFTFASAPIEHTEWKRTARPEAVQMTIKGIYQSSNPLSLFVPFKVPGTLFVRVHETTFGTPDTVTLLFSGKVLNVAAEGNFLTATCSSWLDVFGRRVPKFMMQPRCNYFVFDVNCRAIKAEAGGSVLTISGNQVQIYVDNPPFAGRPESGVFNFFALGFAYHGSGATYEQRSIRQSNVPTLYSSGPDRYAVLVLLDRPFDTLNIGDVLQLVPGCNGSIADCQDKFFNFANYGGHNNVPPTNPSVVGLNPAAPSGNKK